MILKNEKFTIVGIIFLLAIYIPMFANNIGKEKRTILYSLNSDDEPCIILPGESLKKNITLSDTCNVRRWLRVVGKLEFNGKFSERGETLFRESEYQIDDSLDSLVIRNEKYSLFFKGDKDGTEQIAYYRITNENFKAGNLKFKLPVVKKENLYILDNGFFGLEVEIFYKKPGRNVMDIYDKPDSILTLSVNNGTSSSYSEVEKNFVLPEKVACILLKIGGHNFRGNVWLESPILIQEEKQIIDIPFTTYENRKDKRNYWVGCNLSTRSWPKWELKFNDNLCFKDYVFDRASNVADFYIPLPEWVNGDGVFKLKLLEDKPRASFPYKLYSLELIEEETGYFKIVSNHKFIQENRNFGILIETFKPSQKIIIKTSCDTVISPQYQEVFFKDKGLHVIPMYAKSCGINIKLSVSNGKYNTEYIIPQIVRRGNDKIYLSSGDEIYIPKEEQLYDYFFKWYISNRVGNWFQFRPSYQWSGCRKYNLDLIYKYTNLLQQLNMPYAWQVEGRTLAGNKINPPIDVLSSPLFCGKQAHENDGGYNYWFHFNDEGLYSDLAARARPYGGIFAKHRPIYTSKGMFIHYDPYKVKNMSDGAKYLVNNLSYSKGESTRHTGPSTLFRYLYQAGYEWLGAEMMYGPEETVISALRGASKVYNRSLYGTLHAMQWGSKPYTDPEHALRHYISMGIAYIHGSSHINTEEGLWIDEYANDRYSESGKQHLYGQNRILDFIETHTRRGEQISKIAIIQGRNDAWSLFNRESIWSQKGEKWKFNEALKSFDLINVFYPNHKMNWSSPENLFTYTPYGTIDIVPVEASTECLKKYKIVIFLGWNTYEEGDFERIKEFVKDGGILVLTAAHFNTELQPDLETKFPENDKIIKELIGENYKSYKYKKKIQYGKGYVVYFPQKKYPSSIDIYNDYKETIRGLAEKELKKEINESGSISKTDNISYSVWKYNDRKIYYLLNVNWKELYKKQQAVWSCGEYDFYIPVRHYFIETIHQYDKYAIVPSENTTDILKIEKNNDDLIIQIQTTCADELTLFNGYNGKVHKLKISTPGIHNIKLNVK